MLKHTITLGKNEGIMKKNWMQNQFEKLITCSNVELLHITREFRSSC